MARLSSSTRLWSSRDASQTGGWNSEVVRPRAPARQTGAVATHTGGLVCSPRVNPNTGGRV